MCENCQYVLDKLEVKNCSFSNYKARVYKLLRLRWNKGSNIKTIPDHAKKSFIYK